MCFLKIKRLFKHAFQCMLAIFLCEKAKPSSLRLNLFHTKDKAYFPSELPILLFFCHSLMAFNGTWY